MKHLCSSFAWSSSDWFFINAVSWSEKKQNALDVNAWLCGRGEKLGWISSPRYVAISTNWLSKHCSRELLPEWFINIPFHFSSHLSGWDGSNLSFEWIVESIGVSFSVETKNLFASLHRISSPNALALSLRKKKIFHSGIFSDHLTTWWQQPTRRWWSTSAARQRRWECPRTNGTFRSRRNGNPPLCHIPPPLLYLPPDTALCLLLLYSLPPVVQIRSVRTNIQGIFQLLPRPVPHFFFLLLNIDGQGYN